MCGRDDKCEYRNDIRAEGTAANHAGDALEWLKSFADGSIEGVVYDSPYNDAQGLKYTKMNISKSNLAYWYDIRKEIARVLAPGGRVILFAWNTNGFPGCEIEKIWVIAHGSERNDTLVSVHKKL